MSSKVSDSVDVLMATYNGRKYVQDQIRSIQAQTFHNWRLLVSDDGSSDGTQKIIDYEIGRDSRISWSPSSNTQKGSYNNFMYLLGCSDADYSMFCDQDDVWYPDKIEVTLSKMKGLERKYPDSPVMIFTYLEVVDENLNTLSPSFDSLVGINPDRCGLKDLLINPVAPGCTIMINRKLRELVNRFQNTGGVEVHDWWVSLIAATVGHIGYVAQATSKYRQHQDNQIGATKTTLLRSLITTSFESARESICNSMRRANECYKSLGAEMPSEDYKSLRAYLSIPNEKWYRRVFLLTKAGIWKRGALRKAGQAIVTVVMTFPQDLRRNPLE